MDRQWVLSSAEKLDQFFTRSSRADFSSLRQDSVVRPIIRPAAPAALPLGSTFRVGTAGATVIRLEPRASAAKGIMAGIPEAGGAPDRAPLGTITQFHRPGLHESNGQPAISMSRPAVSS